MIVENPARRKPKGPFASAARRYRARGFLGTIPLPPGQKEPPPSKFTGGGKPYPTDDDVRVWRREQGNGNIGLRLAEVPSEFLSEHDDLPVVYAGNNVDGWELIGIDVDNYAKGNGPPKAGAAELGGLEAQLGELPTTALSGARFETGSCIAVYLVPKGYRFAGKVAESIEVVQKRHRYMVVHPSTHPDARDADRQPAIYQWRRGAPSKLAEAGVDVVERFDGELPAIGDVAMLPEAWFVHLTRGGMLESDDPISDLSPSQLAEWMESRPLFDAEPCAVMSKAVAAHIAKIQDSPTSHDRLTPAHWQLLSLAAEGHAGVKWALAEVGRVWREHATGKRAPESLSAEMNRSVLGALGKIQPRYETDGGGYVPDDTCAAAGKFDCEAWAARLDNKIEATDAAPATMTRFRLVSAGELAQPIEPMRWLVRGIWPERSAGVLAGDKKSMKTWNLQAIALAVAAGTALFDKYHVSSPGPVLYLSGEGGFNTFANRHQAIAERYGITEMLAGLPFGAEFGVGKLTDREFTDAVKRHLDELQPVLVILDPLYAYHPSDVEAQNVYARGPMLAALRELIGGESALIVGDHFNKTAGGRLDLSNIAQAGMAQWADSWILQKHRETPNLDENKYWLEIETGTRRGGGKHLEVDWTLERDGGDPDVILWTGVDWEARPYDAGKAESKDSRVAQQILQVVSDYPFELTETAVAEKVGGKRETTREVLNQLKVNGFLEVRNCEKQEGRRMVKRDRVGPGGAIKRLQGTSSGQGTSSPVGNGFTEVVPTGGTGSERVADV